MRPALAVLLFLAAAAPLASQEPAPAEAPAPAPAAPARPKPAEAPAISTAAVKRAKPAVPVTAPLTPSVPPAVPPARPAAAEPGRLSEGVIRLGRDIELRAGQEVAGPVVAFGGSVAADCEVDGPVMALGGSVRLGPLAAVNGPVVAIGGGVQIDPAARIDGPVVDLPGARLFAKGLAALVTVLATLAGLAVFGKLLAGAGWLLVGVVLWAMFPDALKNTRDALERQLPACLVWGLVAWPALTVIGITFLVSILGLPLVPLVALLGAAAYVWGSVAVGFWIGTRLGRGRWESAGLSLVLGLALLKLLAFIPVVRWLALLATAVLGAGAAFASRFGLREPGLIAPADPR